MGIKIKASRQMAQWLRKSIKKYDIKFRTMTPRVYGRQVGDVFTNECDFSPKTGLFSTIEINYPSECYAYPRYLTTRDLQQIARGLANKTIDEFVVAVESAIAI